jgi:hypothetical protein
MSDEASSFLISQRIADGNAGAPLLVSTLGDRDSRCDRNFVLAANTHNRFNSLPVSCAAGSISEANSLPDAAPAQSSKGVRLSRA